MRALFQKTAGLDVHRELVVAAIATQEANGDIVFSIEECATFHSALRDLSLWLKGEGIQLAVMESTGVYWYAVYEAMEDAEVPAIVVNAQHVKKVPGRKTDALDRQWLRCKAWLYCQ